MSDPLLKINLLARSEMALARINAKRLVTRVILYLCLLIFVLFGVAMLNFSLYQVFALYFSAASAGALVAVVNLALAGVLFLIAGAIGGESSEEKMAKEIRDLAYAELSVDVASVKGEISKASDDLKKIQSRINAFTNATGLIVPLANMLTQAMAKKKTKKSTETTTAPAE